MNTLFFFTNRKLSSLLSFYIKIDSVKINKMYIIRYITENQSRNIFFYFFNYINETATKQIPLFQCPLFLKWNSWKDTVTAVLIQFLSDNLSSIESFDTTLSHSTSTDLRSFWRSNDQTEVCTIISFFTVSPLKQTFYSLLLFFSLLLLSCVFLLPLLILPRRPTSSLLGLDVLAVFAHPTRWQQLLDPYEYNKRTIPVLY